MTDISAVVQLHETVLQATLKSPNPDGGTDVTLGASVDDVLSLAGQQLNAEGPAGDVLLFWDASAGKLTYLSLAPGLSITGTVLSVTAGGTGTVTSVNITPPAAGITASGGPIIASGSITLTLADDLAAVEGLSSTGIVRRTGANTWSAGTLVNLANEVTGQLPISTGLSGFGTGIASALAMNVGSNGAPVLFGGPAGTPSNLTLTNAGGLSIAGVTGLSTSLAAKADLVGGVVPTSQIPSVALVAFLGAVNSQANLLLLRGEPGDWAVRTDRATTWVIVANNGASLADWYELPTGLSPVGSVNGQTGTVVLGTGDIGESGGNLYFTNARVLAAIPWAAPGAIGGTTPAGGTFSALAATTTLLLPSAVPSSAAAGHVYRIADTLRYRDSGAVERLLLNATDNLANLSNPSAALANLGGQPLTFAIATIPYAASVELNMATLAGLYRRIDLTGPLTLSTINLAPGRTVTLILTCDATPRNLTVPAGWRWSVKPTQIAASKWGVLSLNSIGTTDGECIAVWWVQS